MPALGLKASGRSRSPLCVLSGRGLCGSMTLECRHLDPASIRMGRCEQKDAGGAHLTCPTRWVRPLWPPGRGEALRRLEVHPSCSLPEQGNGEGEGARSGEGCCQPPHGPSPGGELSTPPVYPSQPLLLCQGKFSAPRTLKKNTLSNVMYIMLCYNVITILYCIPFIHFLLCARRPANSLTSSVAHSLSAPRPLVREPELRRLSASQSRCQWVSLCRVLSHRGPSLRTSVWWDRVLLSQSQTPESLLDSDTISDPGLCAQGAPEGGVQLSSEQKYLIAFSFFG